jgi:hypothetical protein
MGDIIQMATNGIEQFEDMFFVGSNPTYGTAVAINKDPAAIAATEGMFCLNNAASASSLPNTRVCPTYIKLTTHVIGASGSNFTLKLSTDIINRYSSGGSAIAGKNTIAGADVTRRTPKGTCYFGDLTLAAASSEVQVGETTVHWKTIAQSVGDVYMFTFGDMPMPSALVSAAAATAQTYHFPLSPVFLKKGGSLIIQPLSASAATTAATFLVEVGWIEYKR